MCRFERALQPAHLRDLLSGKQGHLVVQGFVSESARKHAVPKLQTLGVTGYAGKSPHIIMQHCPELVLQLPLAVSHDHTACRRQLCEEMRQHEQLL